MTTTTQQTANALTEAIFAVFENIEAVGIGGSLGGGRADEESDIDMFAFVDDRHLLPILAELSESLHRVAGIHSVKEEGWRPLFGFYYSLILTDVFPLHADLFVNSPSTLRKTSMRSDTKLTHERRPGWAQKLEESALDATDSASLACHDLILELDLLYKDLRRDDLLNANERLVALRRVWLAVKHFVTSGRPYRLHGALKDTLPQLGVEIHDKALTLPGLHSKTELTDAACSLADEIHHALNDVSNITPHLSLLEAAIARVRAA